MASSCQVTMPIPCDPDSPGSTECPAVRGALTFCTQPRLKAIQSWQMTMDRRLRHSLGSSKRNSLQTGSAKLCTSRTTSNACNDLSRSLQYLHPQSSSYHIQFYMPHIRKNTHYFEHSLPCFHNQPSLSGLKNVCIRSLPSSSGILNGSVFILSYKLCNTGQ
jgi:hypothetical protein